jgi:hypothetical protein
MIWLLPLFTIVNPILRSMGLPTLEVFDIFEVPFIVMDKNRDLGASAISSICSCMMCLGLVVSKLSSFPFKSAPMYGMLAACSIASCLSSISLTKDTYDRTMRIYAPKQPSS